jgi:hypothetical protein
MKLKLQTRLNARADDVIAHVKTSRLLAYVASPLVVFSPIQPAQLPDVWETGKYLVGMKLFGIIPMRKQWINISFPNADETRVFQMLDDGEGDLVRRWRHLITIASAPDNCVEYTDEVDLNAGWLTLPVFAWAYIYYLYRQARWRRLVEGRFEYAK